MHGNRVPKFMFTSNLMQIVNSGVVYPNIIGALLIGMRFLVLEKNLI